MTTIPSGYENILDNFLGNAYGDEQAGLVTKKDVLWAAFLKENGLSPTDPLVISLDVSVLAKFVAYVEHTYDNLQVNTLSPDEVTRRKLMFSVYDLIVLMLETLQKNVGVVGNNIAFLGRYRREYAEMAGREAGAFYIGGSTNLPKVNVADPTEWTLGYGQITMDDYLTRAVYKSDEGVVDSANLLSVNSKYSPAPTPTVQQHDQAGMIDALEFVRQSELIAAGPATRDGYSSAAVGEARNSLTFTTGNNTVTFKYIYMQQYAATITNYDFDVDGNFVQVGGPVEITGFYPVTTTYTVNLNPTDSIEEKLKATKAGFNTFLNMPMNNYDIIPPGFSFPTPYHAIAFTMPAYVDRGITVLASTTQPIAIFGLSNIPSEATRYVIRNLSNKWDLQYNMVYTSTTDSRQIQYEGAASKRRGQKNSLLQQFITNTQSKTQILTNQSDAQQSQVDQARTGFNQAASLLKTLIGQLATILTSIYQGAR